MFSLLTALFPKRCFPHILNRMSIHLSHPAVLLMLGILIHKYLTLFYLESPYFFYFSTIASFMTSWHVTVARFVVWVCLR